MNIFKKKTKLKTGALDDYRDKKEKEKDFQFCELVAKTSRVKWEDFEAWKEKNKDLLNVLEIHNQDGSGSCVANALSYIASIQNYYEEGKYIQFSPRWIYPRRSNAPMEGMSANDSADLFIKFGAVPEKLIPSDNKNEKEMNELCVPSSYDFIGEIYRPKNYIWSLINIDEFARAIERNKAIMIFVKFGSGEWNKDVPEIKTSLSKANYGHGITGLGFCKYQNKKAIVIVDSWGVDNGMKGLRILTEDWFKQGRVYVGISFENLKNGNFVNEFRCPKHNFKTDLYYGLKNNEEVKILQEVLALLGYFPYNVDFTGNYFGITRKAVLDFQIEYGVIKSKEDEGAGRCGPKTRSKLNEILKKL